MLAMMPSTTTTIISSIREKPRACGFGVGPVCRFILCAFRDPKG
jgi:hypothetical protein